MHSNPPRFLIIIAAHSHPVYSFLSRFQFVHSFLIRAFVSNSCIRGYSWLFVAHSFIIRAHKNAKCRKD